MERIRCFIAVDVDDPSLLSKLCDVQDAINKLGCNVKLVEKENIHVTLRFLGEIPQSLVDEVAKALGKLSGKPFDMRLKGLGAFPSPGRPRVVWVGVADGSQQLIDLYRQVEFSLRPLGFRPEREAFTPHITLARFKSPRALNSLTKLLAEMADADFGLQHVESVKLKRSILTPKGSIYSDLYVKQLG